MWACISATYLSSYAIFSSFNSSLTRSLPRSLAFMTFGSELRYTSIVSSRILFYLPRASFEIFSCSISDKSCLVWALLLSGVVTSSGDGVTIDTSATLCGESSTGKLTSSKIGWPTEKTEELRSGDEFGIIDSPTETADEFRIGEKFETASCSSSAFYSSDSRVN